MIQDLKVKHPVALRAIIPKEKREKNDHQQMAEKKKKRKPVYQGDGAGLSRFLTSKILEKTGYGLSLERL